MNTVYTSFTRRRVWSRTFGNSSRGRENFLFSVIGQNYVGSTVAQNFRTLKRKTSKKLKKELAEISGLKMGQVKYIGK
tara:strand:+ start:852 stop:1085 length:234 start_codon:yes stop_codon:yes gene_type:complete